VRPASALRVLLFLILTMLVMAACGGTTATEAPSDVRESSAPTTEAPPIDQPTSEPSSEPTTPEPASPEPPSAEPETPEPELTDLPASTAECTGTDENVAFYAEFARVVDWAVYCPVLPAGWFVGTGQWRQADGERLEISYRGPGGTGLMLQEGSFCPGDGDCVPTGEDIGPTAFGDREGTLVATDGGWAVVVDRGERPSWLLTISGVGQAAARQIAANVVEVGG
jgi:hypothetical protein